MSLNARKENMYEYACHEGNYAMEGILRGARNQEAQGIKPVAGPGHLRHADLRRTKTRAGCDRAKPRA